MGAAGLYRDAASPLALRATVFREALGGGGERAPPAAMAVDPRLMVR